MHETYRKNLHCSSVRFGKICQTIAWNWHHLCLKAEPQCLLTIPPCNQILVLVWGLWGGFSSPHARGCWFYPQKNWKQLSRREVLRLQVDLFWGRNIRTVDKSKLLGITVQTTHSDEKCICPSICPCICFAETSFSE